MKRTRPKIETTDSAQADAYLHELQTAASGLPPQERAALVEAITEHVRVGVDESDGDPEAIAAMLAALGSPELIVHQAGPERPGPRLTGTDIAAVLLVTVGGLLVPCFGWLAGTALLWASPAWSEGKKVLGSVVFPIGLLLTVLLVRPAGGSAQVGATPLPKTGSSLNIGLGLGVLAIAVLVVVPLAVAIVLLRSGDRNRTVGM